MTATKQIMTEADTCRELVTPKLVVAGWSNAPHVIGDLALEFAHRPVAAQGFGFVEAALEGIVEFHQLFEMAVGKTVDQLLRVQCGDNRELCGQCPHYLGIGAIKGQVAIKLAASGIADRLIAQCSG